MIHKADVILRELLRGDTIQMYGETYKLELRGDVPRVSGLYRKISDGKGNGVEECWEMSDLPISKLIEMCEGLTDHYIYHAAKDQIFKEHGAVE